MYMCFVSFMNVPSDYRYTLPASPCPIRSLTLSHLQTDFLNVQVNKSSLIIYSSFFASWHSSSFLLFTPRRNRTPKYKSIEIQSFRTLGITESVVLEWALKILRPTLLSFVDGKNPALRLKNIKLLHLIPVCPPLTCVHLSCYLLCWESSLICLGPPVYIFALSVLLGQSLTSNIITILVFRWSRWHVLNWNTYKLKYSSCV